MPLHRCWWLLPRRIETHRERWAAVFAGRPTARILIAASTESAWGAQCLEARGHEVRVADPNYAPRYAQRSRRLKTDRRAALVRRRTRWFRVVRALLRQPGYRLRRGATESFLDRVADRALSVEHQADLAPRQERFEKQGERGFRTEPPAPWLSSGRRRAARGPASGRQGLSGDGAGQKMGFGLLIRSPYDGDWVYWSTRQGRHPSVSARLARLLKAQHGRCRSCGSFFQHDDRIEADHINGNHRDSRFANLQALHGHCHDAKTREYGDYLQPGVRDKHHDTEERRAGKLTCAVLEQW